MTHAEHREQCIEAIAKMMSLQYYIGLIGITIFGTTETVASNVRFKVESNWQQWQTKATEVLNSLHGIAWVVAGPISASDTAELLDALDLTNPPESEPVIISRAIDPNTAHMFTNPPEKKP